MKKRKRERKCCSASSSSSSVAVASRSAWRMCPGIREGTDKGARRINFRGIREWKEDNGDKRERDKRYDDDTWLPQNRCCCCCLAAPPPPSTTDERSSCGIFCHSSSSCLPLSSRVNPPFAKLGFFVFVAARKERDWVTPVIYWPGGQAKKSELREGIFGEI